MLACPAVYIWPGDDAGVRRVLPSGEGEVRELCTAQWQSQARWSDETPDERPACTNNLIAAKKKKHGSLAVSSDCRTHASIRRVCIITLATR